MDLSFIREQCEQSIERCHYTNAIFYANKLTTLDPGMFLALF